jgi:hypothetical protein
VSDGFVWFSYIASYGLVIGYAVSLVVRLRRRSGED